MANFTRRRFLGDTLLASAALAAAPAVRALADDSSASPNEQINAMVIGVNGRGQSHIGGFSAQKGVVVTHICDADEAVGQKRCDAIEKRYGKRPKYLRDMREGFDDKSIDVIGVATPNHWHALAGIWAMQAGKDVYLEKPVSHNVTEGRRLAEAARKYKKICQTGTQCRSHKGIQDAVKYVQEGKVGTCKLARAICYKRRKSIGPKGIYQPPESVDYNLWQGPASEQPVTRPRFHYDWHWQYHWGNGDMGNQAPHQIDICRWGLGIDSLSEQVISYGGRLGYIDAGDVANTQVGIHTFDGGDKTLVIEVRGLESDNYRGCGWFGAVFHGSEGYVSVNQYTGGAAYDLDGKKIQEFGGGGDHFANFIGAVRSRNPNDLNAEVLEGHLSAGLAHTGTISYLLGEKLPLSEVGSRLGTVKCNDDVLETFDRMVAHLAKNDLDRTTEISYGPLLKMDPATETFADNDAANAMLTREYRKPFVVPAAGEV